MDQGYGTQRQAGWKPGPYKVINKYLKIFKWLKNILISILYFEAGHIFWKKPALIPSNLVR